MSKLNAASESAFQKEKYLEEEKYTGIGQRVLYPMLIILKAIVYKQMKKTFFYQVAAPASVISDHKNYNNEYIYICLLYTSRCV